MYPSPAPLAKRKHRLVIAGTAIPLLAYSIFLIWALVIVKPGLVAPATADSVCLFVAYIIPIPLVLALGGRGVFVGAVIVWVTLYLAGALLSELDPNRQSSILDGVWLLFGWVGGLLYCGLLYCARVIILALLARAHTFWRARGDERKRLT
jgi:hypothetical protein